uniref:Kinesin-like protein n=1 Tax=Glycine max TaxID=3847 RepID=K7MZZ3_SOYBN
SNITVWARSRLLNSKEKQNGHDSFCIRCIDTETFFFKDEKDEEFVFSFDIVFYEQSEQADVYQFLALPVIRDVVDAINGTIITYGQTGAGKTYSMEVENYHLKMAPGILEFDEQKKGLLPRVRKHIQIKLSMLEIYMEKEWTYFDLSKDNIQIKEIKLRGIMLPGVTEITVLDPAEALQNLSRGIAIRAVGETQMNVASSRSHCIYIFTILQEFSRDKRMRSGKLILVDLAGSEKVEETGAEGRVLEEAKTINKSLSALGNVINSITCGLQGKASHIPYRDSKLTRILQDELVRGNARTALLCCCSPCAFNASESLSTLRFGKKCDTSFSTSSPSGDESRARVLKKLREKLNVEDVMLQEELLIQEGILFDPSSVEEESDIEDLTLQAISSLQAAMEKLTATVDEVR